MSSDTRTPKGPVRVRVGVRKRKSKRERNRGEEGGKGGVVKRPVVHARVLGRVSAWMIEHSLRLGGLVASPILGVSGNKEFFVLLKLT